MKRLVLGLAAVLVCCAGLVRAEAPPAVAPGVPFGTGLQPVAIYDAAGNIISSFGGGSGGGGGGATGSVTAAGTNGSLAQAIQGINGGVNVGVSAASWPLPTGAATAAAQATGNASLGSLDTKTPALVNGGRPVTVLNQTAPGSMEQDVRTSGTLNAATLNAAVTTAINGQGTVGYTFIGLTGTGATLTYEQSIDGGTTWTGINAVNRGTGVPEATRTTDGQIALSATGRTTIRVRVSTAGTGTITVATNVSVREGIFSLGSPLPPGSNDVGGVLAGNDGTTNRKLTTTTTGALEPPTAAAGKIARIRTEMAANTSTTIAAANANRIAFGVQCGTGGVSIDEAGAALTGAAVGNGTLFIPSGSANYFTPPVTTRTAITAYTATAQTCVVTEYLR